MELFVLVSHGRVTAVYHHIIYRTRRTARKRAVAKRPVEWSRRVPAALVVLEAVSLLAVVEPVTASLLVTEAVEVAEVAEDEEDVVVDEEVASEGSLLPHLALSLHSCWPSASSGCALMHCA